MKIPRRNFLLQSPALGAAIASAQTRRTSSGPFRLGAMNVVNYSHIALWGPLINPRPDRKESAFTGMRITHCWEIDAAKSEEFARAHDCESVKNFDDMVGKVDGIISGGFYNYAWNHILHEPYLKAGLPNLINRPFANSLARARQMIDLAQKHGATILSPSAFEHNESIARARAWAADKKILSYNASNSFDDYPTHGVHGVWMVNRAIAQNNNPIVSVAYRADSWHNPPGVMTFEHRDKGGRQFFGTLHQVPAAWGMLNIQTPGETGGRMFEIYGGSGPPFNQTELWAPAVWVYQNMAMHREMPETFEQIYQKTNVFLAGFRSILENEGRPVRLENVPENWTVPVELPTHPGDPTVDLFRKKFGPER
jgi:hypothetical protein